MAQPVSFSLHDLKIENEMSQLIASVLEEDLEVPASLSCCCSTLVGDAGVGVLHGGRRHRRVAPRATLTGETE